MKRSSKFSASKFSGLLFTLVCFAGAALGLWLFWMDLNQVLLKRSETPVGTLSYKRHVVQRRFEDRLVWNQMPHESPVYNGDLVRTSELSDAVIAFVSNDSVNLSENSLIHIRYDEKADSFIELLSGDISLISAGGRMGIVSGDQKLIPGSGGILRVRRADEGTEATVLSGSAEIAGPGGNLDLEAGQSVMIGPDDTVEVAETLAVSGPLPNQEFQSAENPSPVTFSWNSLPQGEYVRLEIASDQDFTEPVYAVDEYSAGGTVVFLPPGAWWWRMFHAEQGSPLPSSPARDGRLTVLEMPAAADPESLFPPAPAVISEEAPFNLPVLHAVPAAAAPSAPVESPPAESPPAESPPAAAQPAPAESPRPSAPALLPPPANLFPPPETIIDAAWLKKDPRIIFSWDPVDGANGYIVTIRRGLALNLYQVREPRFVFTGLSSMDNGEWIWQVEAVSLTPGGAARQHGEPAAAVFNLEVPQPQAPAADNPGIIYE